MTECKRLGCDDPGVHHGSLPKGFTPFDHTIDQRPAGEFAVDVITKSGKEIGGVLASTLAWGSNIVGWRHAPPRPLYCRCVMTPVADAGWIDYHPAVGAACPVPETAVVDVMLRGGKVLLDAVAADILWGHVGPFEVERYRIAREAPELCNDEGCPQHGTPHVCVDKTAERPPLKHLVSLCVQLHKCCTEMETMSAMDAVDNGHVDGAAELDAAIRAEIAKIIAGERE